MSDHPQPFVPAGVDLQDFPCMMLNIGRLRGSEFDAITDDGAWRAGFNLWLSSWHQVPAGSLKGNDAQLAKLAGLGRDLTTWERIKADAMRGWVLCADGRYYHRTVCEVALEAWLTKLRQRDKSGKGNRTRWGSAYDPEATAAERQAALRALDFLRGTSQSAPAQPAISQEEQDESPRDAPGMPQRSQGKGREGIDSEPTVQRAAPEDHNKEAWRRAIAVLMDQGRMSDPKARVFFGFLFKEHPGLEPRDLLPSIIVAEGNGTGEPQSYLIAAANAVAERKGLGAAARQGVEDWSPDVWRVAVRAFKETGEWGEAGGAEPGKIGCRAPAEVLAEFGYSGVVIPIGGRATA